VCRESREVARRLWNNGQTDKPLWEHECTVPVFQKLDTARTEPLNALLAIDPPAENHLVLDLRSELRPAFEGPTSPLASLRHGRRLLDLLLAAKDDQIKVLLRETQTFCLPYGAGTPPLPPAAEGWIKGTRLVSINDVSAWEELKEIGAHYGLPWPFAETVLGGLSSRTGLVADAVRPLQSLWERESARRKKAKMERLKPLPRIDVVTYVEVSRGGTIGMLGFTGVPDPAALKDLLAWGVL
jgi:hypothetical protein